MTTISARTILRSLNASAPDKVLSTLLLRYPRFIHAEFMTHRALSRNAASSRAIPVKKIIDDILADTAMPLHWGKAQAGMQAFEQIGDVERKAASIEWRRARNSAVESAQTLIDLGLHKQVANRLLEPFSHITVLVSATEWSNFLELRDHEMAEPHIQMLAREIRACLEDESTIQTLQPGEWHLPFVTNYPMNFGHKSNEGIKVSVARCASTSYKTVDGFDMTLEKAVELHDKLVGSRPIHASPCEHVAQADNLVDRIRGSWAYPEEHANFCGFRQYRKQLEHAA